MYRISIRVDLLAFIILAILATIYLLRDPLLTLNPPPPLMPNKEGDSASSSFFSILPSTTSLPSLGDSDDVGSVSTSSMSGGTGTTTGDSKNGEKELTQGSVIEKPPLSEATLSFLPKSAKKKRLQEQQSNHENISSSALSYSTSPPSLDFHFSKFLVALERSELGLKVDDDLGAKTVTVDKKDSKKTLGSQQSGNVTSGGNNSSSSNNNTQNNTGFSSSSLSKEGGGNAATITKTQASSPQEVLKEYKLLEQELDNVLAELSNKTDLFASHEKYMESQAFVAEKLIQLREKAIVDRSSTEALEFLRPTQTAEDVIYRVPSVPWDTPNLVYVARRRYGLYSSYYHIPFLEPPTSTSFPSGGGVNVPSREPSAQTSSHLLRGRKRLRVAVEMSGHMRTFRRTYQSCVDNVLKPNHALLFMSTYPDIGDKRFGVRVQDRDDPAPHKEIVSYYTPYLASMYTADVPTVTRDLAKMFPLVFSLTQWSWMIYQLFMMELAHNLTSAHFVHDPLKGVSDSNLEAFYSSATSGGTGGKTAVSVDDAEESSVERNNSAGIATPASTSTNTLGNFAFKDVEMELLFSKTPTKMLESSLLSEHQPPNPGGEGKKRQEKEEDTRPTSITAVDTKGGNISGTAPNDATTIHNNAKKTMAMSMLVAFGRTWGGTVDVIIRLRPDLYILGRVHIDPVFHPSPSPASKGGSSSADPAGSGKNENSKTTSIANPKKKKKNSKEESSPQQAAQFRFICGGQTFIEPFNKTHLLRAPHHPRLEWFADPLSDHSAIGFRSEMSRFLQLFSDAREMTPRKQQQLIFYHGNTAERIWSEHVARQKLKIIGTFGWHIMLRNKAKFVNSTVIMANSARRKTLTAMIFGVTDPMRVGCPDANRSMFRLGKKPKKTKRKPGSQGTPGKKDKEK